MPRSTRSRSRGRTNVKSPEAKPKAKTPAKAAKAAPPKQESPKMAFDEGDNVMARWPGSSLFFKAKVTYVRDEDNEYDVEYENGTVYTIKAKDVYKRSSAVLKKAERKRSVSRGRSPARSTKKSGKSAEATPKPAKDQTDSKKVEKIDREKVKEVKAETPTRVSARIAAKALSDAYSDDETEKVKLAPNPELPDSRGKKRGWSLEWMWALLFMAIGPALIVSLHKLCGPKECRPAVPKLSTDFKDYFDKNTMMGVVGFLLSLDVLSFLPIGAVVNGRRMNGFLTLLTCLAAIPAMHHYKLPLGLVKEKFFFIMTSCIMLSFVTSLCSFIIARWGLKSNVNSKGNTGNILVDIFNGRELNPKHFGWDWKLQTFRGSMILLAMLNAVMVFDAVQASGGIAKANPTLLVASAFQLIYAMDALFFEEYYFQSHDAMNSGFGWSLIFSYSTFPFLPTLTTLYLLNRPSINVPWYYLLAIAAMNAIGYVIFRSSETQRCEFAKDPKNPSLAHLETLSAAGNKKLIVSGWWGLVRHPNYLGEVLIQWSWVLPAVCSLGLKDLIPYYLPVVTTLMLIVRTHQINQRNKRKYGQAWNTYTEKVRSNIIPKVY